MFWHAAFLGDLNPVTEPLGISFLLCVTDMVFRIF